VDVARDTFGATITEGSFAKTLSFARECLPDNSAERFEDAMHGVFNGLRDWVQSHGAVSQSGYSGNSPSNGAHEDAVRVPLDTAPEFPVSLDALVTELQRIGARAAAIESKLDARERDHEVLSSEERKVRARARSTARRTGKQLVSLALFNRGAVSDVDASGSAQDGPAARLREIAEKYALWVELDRVVTGERTVRLEARRVDVRDTLSELLWSEIPCVLTSATLTVEGRFDHVEGETGARRSGSKSPRPSTSLRGVYSSCQRASRARRIRAGGKRARVRSRAWWAPQTAARSRCSRRTLRSTQRTGP